jgi:tetratricopeptide (TPR) repeat protein
MSRHMGRVIAAYRHHPFHGQPLRQETVAGWVFMTQPQLSRVENGPPIRDLDKLILWARTLRIPSSLLWFKLPEDTTSQLAERNAQPPRADRGVEAWWSRFANQEDAAVLGPPGQESRLPSCELDEVLTLVTSPRLSPATIEALEASIRDLWKRDDQYGGETLRPAVIAQLRYVLRLLTECSREDQRRRLTVIAAEFARLAGWMFFDARQYSAAHTYFEEALRLAKQIHDRSFIANVLACLSLQATYEDNPADALALARAAQDTCRGTATPRVMAMLSMREAFAHAALPDKSGCRIAISQSHASFENIDGADRDPAWVAYFDETKLTADTGIALSRLGDHQAAEPLLVDALDRQSPSNTRTLAFHTFWLSKTQLQAGNLDQSLGTATKVLELATSVASARIAGHVQEFQHSLTPFAREQLTKDFNARAAEFLKITAFSPYNPAAHTATPPTTRC